MSQSLSSLLSSLSSSLDNTSLTINNWDEILSEFISNYSFQLTFIPNPFTNIQIKQNFLNLYKNKRLFSKDFNLNLDLNFLRIILRESNGLNDFLTSDVLQFFLNLLQNDLNNKNLILKSFLNFIHHSRELRLQILQNYNYLETVEKIQNSLELNNLESHFLFSRFLFYLTFEEQNANFIVTKNLNILQKLIQEMNFYFNNFLQQNVTSHLTTENKTLEQSLEDVTNHLKEMEGPTTTNTKQHSVTLVREPLRLTFSPFFLSFLEDGMKTLYNCFAHVNVEELTKLFENDLFPLLSNTIHFYSFNYMIFSFKDCIQSQNENLMGDNDDYDWKENFENTKDQLFILIRHTLQICMWLSLEKLPNESKEEFNLFTKIVNENNFIVILYAFISEYINHIDKDSDYVDFLVPIIKLLENLALTYPFCKDKLYDWIFNDINWPLQKSPTIKQNVIEMIKERNDKFIRKREERNKQMKDFLEKMDSDEDLTLSQILKASAEQEEEKEQETTEENKQASSSSSSSTIKEEEKENKEEQEEKESDSLDASDLIYKQIKTVFIMGMTSTNYDFKTVLCNFLFILCNQDAKQFASDCGVGNAVGFLGEKGLIGNVFSNINLQEM
ncbi:hypothetical protein ABK040_015496 [Willaertia magna]